MFGAMIGDIAGSRFEFNNIRSKEFELFTEKCFLTDDSIMTIAIGKALMECRGNYTVLSEKAVYWMREIGKRYPLCGFGGRVFDWIFSDDPKPYGSYGNGSAMRVGCAGEVASSLEEAIFLADEVTKVTHNHPEGMKGAEATAAAVFLAKEKKSIAEIREYIEQNFYLLDFKLDDIRDTYQFNESCQGTVPQAIEAFLESTDFEDAIRNAISIGGDSDTLAAITGGIAGAYYGVPKKLQLEAMRYLDDELLEIVTRYEYSFMKKQQESNQ